MSGDKPATVARGDQRWASVRDGTGKAVRRCRAWMADNPTDIGHVDPMSIAEIDLMPDEAARGLATVLLRLLAESDWERDT